MSYRKLFCEIIVAMWKNIVSVYPKGKSHDFMNEKCFCEYLNLLRL